MTSVDQLESRPKPSARSGAGGGWRGIRRGARVTAPLLCLALLIGGMGLTGYRLFSGMTTVGMRGVDTFEYWKYADQILHGRHDFVFDRLSFYAVNILAFKVLGANDYAIRAFVGGLAVLNIALVYLLSYLISRSALVAIAAAALYAFNPTVLTYAVIELPHITGATFVLLSALLALIATDQSAGLRIRLAASCMMGVTVAGAVLTHEDLVLLGVGYSIIIALPLGAQREPSVAAGHQRRRELALTLGAFALGSGVGAAWPMIATGVGPGKIFHDFFALRAAIDENTATRTSGEFFKIVPVRIISNFTLDTMGWALTALAAALALIVPVAVFMRRLDRLKTLLTLEIPVLVYIAGFIGLAQIYLEGTYERLFVPLIGPVIVFALCGGYLLLQPLLRGIAAVAVAASAAFVLVGYEPWSYAPRPVTQHRQLYDAVKDRVTPEQKLLLPACFALDADWVGIGSGVYLGDNVVPIYLMIDFVSFDALVAAKHVGYVLVPTAPLRGMWPREQMQELFLATYGQAMVVELLGSLPRLAQEVWHGDTRVEWSPRACAFEAQVVRRLLEERGARLSVTAPGVGDIYELPRQATLQTPGGP